MLNSLRDRARRSRRRFARRQPSPGEDGPINRREYHEWQLYDHLPENRALDGVAWGERWARIAGAGDVEVATEDFAGVDSMTMYWFKPPYAQGRAEWDKLGSDSIQWGRGPGIPAVVRRFMGFFVPVQGYVAPHALVGADVLPYRPNRGVHVAVTRLDQPQGHDAHLQYRWYDRTRMPDLTTVPGVAGGWTFSLREASSPGWEGGAPKQWAPHEVRVRLLYLDEDPVETTARITEHERRWDAEGRGSTQGGAEEILFSAPFSVIVPFQPCPPVATGGGRG